MFEKILIANRGEIACRVARTARVMGIRAVAVYSDADAGSAHVEACDEALHIGGPRPQDSYLRGEIIIAAAQRSGAQAIHPGYGFLSENAAFARACGQAGIVFIGPSPEAIAAMGSKSAAKALMHRAGVPLTPGYHGERQEPDYLLTQAARIGFPVLIKAVAGGGGKGMRRVDSAGEFIAALASCQREARASFKDERVLVEKYLTSARHIEVQVFGDNHGNCVHLFERDCSVQRRHQKVLEEAPAPGISAERRAQMGAAAVAAARAVNYSGAGTVEFIAEGDAFYFMEMNTRLQVEHPVTELITGFDLVEWQLRIAAGEKLPCDQAGIAMRGHAIEARVYAEDPARDFLPSIGTLHYLSAPAISGELRLDTGVRQGDEITVFYDPMIAKLAVYGPTRAVALARMRAALAQFHVAGVATNLALLSRLITAPSFVDARLDTALIERERAHLFPAPLAVSRREWELAVLAWVLTQAPKVAVAASPWADIGGWRLVGSARRQLRWRMDTEHREIELTYGTQSTQIQIDGRVTAASGTLTSNGQLHAVIADQLLDEERVTAMVHTQGRVIHLFFEGRHRVFEWLDPYLPVDEAIDAHGGLRAVMPGRVLNVLVKPGDSVRKGMPLVVLEAMKMEHTITAPSAGKILIVLCAEGEQVKEGAELLEIEPWPPR